MRPGSYNSIVVFASEKCKGIRWLIGQRPGLPCGGRELPLKPRIAKQLVGGGGTRLCGSKIIAFLVQDYFLRECVHDSWTAQLKNWNHTCVSEGLT